jgi:hypothetical protein
MVKAGQAELTECTFPPLRDSDIVLCMQELNIPFADEDLKRPTPQRVQMAYEAFLDILMGYTRESFEANVRACASEVDYFVSPLAGDFSYSRMRTNTRSG